MPQRLVQPQMPVLYSVIILFVIAAGLAGMGMFYTQRVAADTKADIAEAEAERDRNLCDVINASLGIKPGDPTPNITAATTPRGREVVQAMIDLRGKLGCP